VVRNPIEYGWPVSVFATASGTGSWPGTSARQAAEVVVGELGAALAHLVELPARGVGADIVGRAGALLIDVAIDTVPRGYRIAARPGAVTRRAVSLLDEDIDALEEAWETAGMRGSGRPVKVQAPGPITLAAELELSNGHRAIRDLGAVNDIAASLAEGVAAHRASVSRRLDTPVVVQFDEPSLPAAVTGRLAGVTALSPVAPIDETLATAMLDICAAAAGAEVSVHSCGAAIPWKVLQRSNINAVSVDAGTLQVADLDAIAEFLESGRVVVLGVVSSSAPPRRPAVEEVAGAVVTITDRLGFSRSALRDRVGITPACGLAAATPQWARTAIGLARRAAEAFAEDPDAI
jgi:methionine synthase II (cobalamin-independent)